MSPTATQTSAEQLFALPSGERCELVRGEVRDMSPAGFDHGAIVMTLGSLLFRHVTERALGTIVGGEAGFVLSRNPDTVRAVDIGFVSAQRVAAQGRPSKYWEGPPDLAVEVLSPSDTIGQVEEKVDDYLTAGTRLVWVINPRRKTVTVYRSNSGPMLIDERDLLTGEDVLPEFRCAVAEIFA